MARTGEAVFGFLVVDGAGDMGALLAIGSELARRRFHHDAWIIRRWVVEKFDFARGQLGGEANLLLRVFWLGEADEESD